MQTKGSDKFSSLYLSAHPSSLIESVPYSQALILKKIFTETSELSKNLQVLNENFLNTEFQRLSEIEGEALLAPKSKEKDLNRTSFVITYNKTLRNVKQIINKH